MENPQQAGDRIYNALLHGKKKEEVVFDVILNNNYEKRMLISQYYKSAYTNTLFDDIKSIGGDFSYAASLMFLNPLEFCIKLLGKAVDKKDKICIFELLSSKSLDEIKLIEDVYQKEYDKSLRDGLDKIFSGVMKKNVLNFLTTKRNQDHNPKKK